jgi:hypothetical protein
MKNEIEGRRREGSGDAGGSPCGGEWSKGGAGRHRRAWHMTVTGLSYSSLLRSLLSPFSFARHALQTRNCYRYVRPSSLQLHDAQQALTNVG